MFLINFNCTIFLRENVTPELLENYVSNLQASISNSFKILAQVTKLKKKSEARRLKVYRPYDLYQLDN